MPIMHYSRHYGEMIATPFWLKLFLCFTAITISVVVIIFIATVITEIFIYGTNHSC